MKKSQNLPNSKMGGGQNEVIIIVDSAIFAESSSSRSDFLGSASARFLDELSVLSTLLASHNHKNSSAILEFIGKLKNIQSNVKNTYHSKQFAKSNPKREYQYVA